MVSRYFTAESSLLTNASTILFIIVVLAVILVIGWMTKWETKHVLLVLWQHNYSKINLNFAILLKIKVLVIVRNKNRGKLNKQGEMLVSSPKEECENRKKDYF